MARNAEFSVFMITVHVTLGMHTSALLMNRTAVAEIGVALVAASWSERLGQPLTACQAGKSEQGQDVATQISPMERSAGRRSGLPKEPVPNIGDDSCSLGSSH